MINDIGRSQQPLRICVNKALFVSSKWFIYLTLNGIKIHCKNSTCKDVVLDAFKFERNSKWCFSIKIAIQAMKSFEICHFKQLIHLHFVGVKPNESYTVQRLNCGVLAEQSD